MAEVQTLAAEARTQAGKGPARAARREGKVPAVIYGNKEEPVAVNIDRITLELELHKAGFFIQLIDIEVDGKSHRVLPRDVQFHPVTDVPMHVDFLRFDASRKITAEVPVSFVNESESPGLRGGGVLNVVRFEVEVSCTADNIPQEFEVDLTGLEVGDSIHASMIKLPDGVEFTITDRDFTVATIAAPTIVEEPVEDEEGLEGEEGLEEGAEEGAEDDGGEDEGGEE